MKGNMFKNTKHIIPTPHGEEIQIPYCTYLELEEKIRGYLKFRVPGVYTRNQMDFITYLTDLHFLLNQKEQMVSVKYAFHLIDGIVRFAKNMKKSEDIRCEFLTQQKNVFPKLLIRAHYLAHMAIMIDKEDDIDSLEEYFNSTMEKVSWYNKLLEAIKGLIQECHTFDMHGFLDRVNLHPENEEATVSDNKTLENRVNNLYNQEEENNKGLIEEWYTLSMHGFLCCVNLRPGYEGATVSDKKALKNRANNLYNQEEENNMKIVGVYSNEKKGRTTIKFADGRIVSVQCDEEDKFDTHKGIAMALAKAAFGSKVLQECLSSYSEQKSGEENKKAKKARKEKAEAKKEKEKAKKEEE